MAGNTLDEETRYLIRLDKDFFGIADTEEIAVKIMEDLARSEEERLITLGSTVYRKYHTKNTIHLFTQTGGKLFQGSLVPGVILSVTPVAKHTSPYAQKIAQYKADKAKKSSAC
jgi:hypothetical protein